mmetsp:Transcript_26347/g.51526  ORF Transcript_26347/g.51526 Transcript_26347/m.51526 type:complete len:294 (-) Transcript_26347:245-1126(-)
MNFCRVCRPHRVARTRSNFLFSTSTRSDEYLHGHEDAVLRSHRARTVYNSAGYLLPHLREGMKLLDVGCGPGSITADFASIVGRSGSVIAIDSAKGILEDARRALAARGFEDGVVVEVGDVYDLKYDDDSFDVVHAHQVLQHLSDPVAALKEMRRVCKTDGIVACRDADYAAMFWYPRVPKMEEWQTLYRTLSKEKNGEPDAGRMVFSWARKAGFSSVEASSDTWCYATDETRKWWGGLWADRILKTAIARQALAGGHATQTELEEMSNAWKEWSEDPDAWFTVPHGEIMCRP